MASERNKGYDPGTIREYSEKMKEAGRPYLVEEEDENTDEYAHFYFIGKFEGRESVYDAVIYTLRLHHESELYEIAEQRAAKHFPDYKRKANDGDENENPETFDPREEEIGLYMAEVILELEEEEAVKVKEHIEINSDAEFGVSLDVGLHVDKITPKIIQQFITDYNADKLNLDDTLYSFQASDEEAG